MNVKAKYLKDESGTIIAPVTNTKAVFNDNGKNIVDYILDRVYPIGSIYSSMQSTDPATLFGGTWERLKDRFLLGVGDTYKTVSTTGGSATNTHAHWTIIGYDNKNCLYVSEEQYLNNGERRVRGRSIQRGVITNVQSSSSDENDATRENGTYNETIDIMPPYLTVYMWKRTK